MVGCHPEKKCNEILERWNRAVICPDGLSTITGFSHRLLLLILKGNTDTKLYGIDEEIERLNPLNELLGDLGKLVAEIGRS